MMNEGLGGANIQSYIKEIIGWLEAILIAVVLYILIHSFFIETTAVNMSSMENTLQSGQRLILYKLGKFVSKPHRGDIVAFVHQEGRRKGLAKLLIPFPDPDEVDYIKRVIALPGEEIDIREGKVYIDGKALSEPYVKGGLTDDKDMSFPRTVPEDMLFVMGDNRAVSRDSREIGFVEVGKIRGKAVFSIWPLNRFGIIR